MFFPLGTQEICPRYMYMVWGFSVGKLLLFLQLLRHHLANWGMCLLIPPRKEWQGLQDLRKFEGRRLVVSFHQYNLCAQCHFRLSLQSCTSCDSLSTGLLGMSSFGNSLILSPGEKERPAGILIWCIFLKEKSLTFLPHPWVKIWCLNSGISGVKKLQFYTNFLTSSFSL